MNSSGNFGEAHGYMNARSPNALQGYTSDKALRDPFTAIGYHVAGEYVESRLQDFGRQYGSNNYNGYPRASSDFDTSNHYVNPIAVTMTAGPSYHTAQGSASHTPTTQLLKYGHQSLPNMVPIVANRPKYANVAVVRSGGRLVRRFDQSLSLPALGVGHMINSTSADYITSQPFITQLDQHNVALHQTDPPVPSTMPPLTRSLGSNEESGPYMLSSVHKTYLVTPSCHTRPPTSSTPYHAVRSPSESSLDLNESTQTPMDNVPTDSPSIIPCSPNPIPSALPTCSTNDIAVCIHCGEIASGARKYSDRMSNLKRHIRDKHECAEGTRLPCPESGCGKTFERSDYILRHRRRSHGLESATGKPAPR